MSHAGSRVDRTRLHGGFVLPCLRVAARLLGAGAASATPYPGRRTQAAGAWPGVAGAAGLARGGRERGPNRVWDRDEWLPALIRSPPPGGALSGLTAGLEGRAGRVAA